jgi:hypothetical protein
MKVATNLALSGALMFWMAAFAQEAVKPAAAPAPVQAGAAATTPQDCGMQTMEKMHASHMGGMKGMKSGESMKSGCMGKDISAADASATAKPDEHDHPAHSRK